MFKSIFDNTKPNALVNKFRKKRFRFFKEILDKSPKPVHILDIGGTQNYWEQMGIKNSTEIFITLLNTQFIETKYTNFTFIKGDARDLKNFNDKQFDIVFSNSVIEHLESFDDQKSMANEIIRTGKIYFVQTPNYYFPFEPHFLFPFFQFLPINFKIFLITHFNLGWFKKQKTREEALELIKSINLLKKQQILELFPNSSLLEENVLFLIKSYTAISI